MGFAPNDSLCLIIPTLSILSPVTHPLLALSLFVVEPLFSESIDFFCTC